VPMVMKKRSQPKKLIENDQSYVIEKGLNARCVLRPFFMLEMHGVLVYRLLDAVSVLTDSAYA